MTLCKTYISQHARNIRTDARSKSIKKRLHNWAKFFSKSYWNFNLLFILCGKRRPRMQNLYAIFLIDSKARSFQPNWVEFGGIGCAIQQATSKQPPQFFHIFRMIFLNYLKKQSTNHKCLRMLCSCPSVANVFFCLIIKVASILKIGLTPL